MADATIFTAVWGSEYVKRFQSLTLRTLLAPRNLPTFSHQINTQYLIVTTPKDRALLEASVSLRKLSEIVQIKYLELPALGSTNVDRKNLAWELATKHVQDQGHYAIQMPPDVIWSDGSFEHLGKLILSGKKAIFLNWHLRALEEYFIPAFERLFPASDEPASIASRDLVRLTLSYSHPLNGIHMRGADCFSYWPEMFFWPVKEQGVLMHALALTPFVFDTSTCRLNERRLLAHHCKPEQLAFVTDSDNLFMTSLANIGKDRHFYARYEKLEISRLAWWWLMVHTPTADNLALSPYRLKYAHSDELNWQQNEQKAANFLRRAFHSREMYRIWEASRRLGLKYSSAILAYTLSVGLAGALARNSSRVTAYLPIDDAIEPYWGTKIEAILCGEKRILVEFLRAHFVTSKGVAAYDQGWRPEKNHPIGTKIGSATIVAGPIAAGTHTIYLIDKVLGLDGIDPSEPTN